MSTGISISSINRIKELAEEKKYAEALEILDTQNLDKSINPQFLRISGEIFRHNKRYYDSRRILMKSHEMSPQGTRIIFELIELYLELGYYTRANKYYEQYKFYSTQDDTQRDYVEYVMKKATGAEIKELAAILIPILERMPEDRWNFEAMLLYDKMDRKDKALEEGQHILENFKDSIYIKPVIEYIDDKLDVDEYFYVYPKEEVPEDREMFGDLIDKEDKLMEADYLRMYPPEARIMVEADDNDAMDVKPVKEKKPKKKRFAKNKDAEDGLIEELQGEAVKPDSADKKEKTEAADTAAVGSGNEKDITAKTGSDTDMAAKDNSHQEDGKSTDNINDNANPESKKDADNSSVEAKKPDAEVQKAGDEVGSTSDQSEEHIDEEEAKKKEREAALEKLLSRKLDKDALKESAKQMAKNVTQDTKKATSQVKTITDSVVDNVKKATDTIGEAVGAGKSQTFKPEPSEEIMDGIIESVIEPPKKSVGRVILNEELDALVPDTLEAMSADEVADHEARNEERERMELEALEASLRKEEEKKNRKESRKDKKANSTEEAEAADTTGQASDGDNQTEDEAPGTFRNETVASISFAELKARFLADNAKEEEEEPPLDSLGFITVVQSDVDAKMEDEAPEAADILHRMIDNKEYYSGEDSRGFESKASYENHGFEVDDYSFGEYIGMELDDQSTMDESAAFEGRHKAADQAYSSDHIYKVEEIFTDNSVLDFDDILPEFDPNDTARTMVKPDWMVEAPDNVQSTDLPEPVYEADEDSEPHWVSESLSEPEWEGETVQAVEADEEPKWTAEPETEIAQTVDAIGENEHTVGAEEAEQTVVDELEPEWQAEPETEIAQTFDAIGEIEHTVEAEEVPEWQAEPEIEITQTVDATEEIEQTVVDEVAPEWKAEPETEIAQTVDTTEEIEQAVVDEVEPEWQAEPETEIAQTVDATEEKEQVVVDEVEPEWKAEPETEIAQTVDTTEVIEQAVVDEVEREWKAEPETEITQTVDATEEKEQVVVDEVEPEWQAEPETEIAQTVDTTEVIEQVVEAEKAPEMNIASNREMFRVRIVLTDYMIKGLLELKESR